MHLVPDKTSVVQMGCRHGMLSIAGGAAPGKQGPAGGRDGYGLCLRRPPAVHTHLHRIRVGGRHAVP